MGERPVLLVVDDEELILELLTDVLQDEFTVVTATNGRAALEALQSLSTVSGVITDLRMPLMDGAELIKLIRRSYPDLPILGLSGTYEYRRGDAASEGFLFLRKPFLTGDLLSAARLLFQPKA
ncbi:MAG: hypothetical protein CFK52_05895 [Chloracidobacterium sp. CP2_5A]|nr:MAG: hypothetical protein CFK52_05895 [Chloracidobacterium sp. CP2_5A]